MRPLVVRQTNVKGSRTSYLRELSALEANQGWACETRRHAARAGRPRPRHPQLGFERGHAWLSPTPVCTDVLPVSTFVALIAPGALQISPTYVCVDGAPGSGRIVAQLQESESHDVAQQTIEVRPDPVVVKVDGVHAAPIGAGGAAATESVDVQLSYQNCDGSGSQVSDERSPRLGGESSPQLRQASGDLS
jgi:hypothetical protein